MSGDFQMKRMTSLLGAASMMALAAGAAQAGEITGRVTESTGTVGLQGAIVRISETGQTVSSARDGSFRLSNVPAGDFTLMVDYLGADAQTRSVTLISADDQVETNFVLGADVAADDNILIIGQRGQLTSALNRQRAAAGLISVLSADAVDRLPDENVAEAARRIAGVNVLNDQGEGRFVSIRGIDPNLNTTTVNGVRLPSPEADNRQVPLDVIDSDVLSSIVISKSLTPDMSGDTIGGNIEIETLSGLDQDERLLQLSLRGIYADVVEEFGYRGSLTFADNFMDGRLGVALSISDQLRKFGSENAEVDGGWETGVSVPFPGEFENRNYDITRERTSVVFNLDFDATESTNLYLRSTYSDFSDQEYRSRVENKFEDPDYLDSSSGGGAFFDASTGDEFEVDRDIKDRLEEQTIYAIAVGGETFTGPWTLDYQLAYAYAEEAEPDRIDTGFRAKFDEGVFGVNVNDAMLPQVIFGDAAAEAAYLDASNYEFDGLEFLNGVAEDDEWSFQFNVQRDMAFGQYFGFIKSGVQYRTREKSYDATALVYGGYDNGSGDDLTLAGFA
ncbi:MAG TPA: TonB-dependent receptor, partial [Oceanicaulis sp.]|nr:TonB-dependent receptor [Oceanicaulis sp.]